MHELKMSARDLEVFLEAEFPQVGREFEIRSVAPMRLELALLVGEAHLRPGGTVSGPSMFALADVGVYLALLSMIGPKALAVTTSCSIDFMRKPQAGKTLVAGVELLKLGRTLAVGDVRMWSEGSEDKPVARATLTYSIP